MKLLHATDPRYSFGTRPVTMIRLLIYCRTVAIAGRQPSSGTLYRGTAQFRTTKSSRKNNQLVGRLKQADNPMITDVKLLSFSISLLNWSTEISPKAEAVGYKECIKFLQ